jgi:mRNA interferase YafQ
VILSAKSEVITRRELEGLLMLAVELLLDDKPLPDRNRNHALGGGWRDHRECHLKPDLLLLYRKPDSEVLQLIRLGSHSELFRLKSIRGQFSRFSRRWFKIEPKHGQNSA